MYLNILVSMSVGWNASLHMISLWIWYYPRILGYNQLQGIIPDVISTLVKLTRLYALNPF